MLSIPILSYCFAITPLSCRNGLCGSGIALTLGKGSRLVCNAIERLTITRCWNCFKIRRPSVIRTHTFPAIPWAD